MKRSVGVAMALMGCGPADGAVFVDAPDPVDITCDGELGERIQGNDARFDQGCGYECDSDWCGCEPCEMVAAPFARLSAGEHELRVEGGASGEGSFELTLTRADGEVLLEEVRTYNGLFADVFTFTVSQDCPVVHVSWTLQSEVCSRVYEFQIDPPAM